MYLQTNYHKCTYADNVLFDFYHSDFSVEPNEPVVKSEISIKEECLSDYDNTYDNPSIEENKFSKENLNAIINHTDEPKEPIQENKLFDYNVVHDSNDSSTDINTLPQNSLNIQNFESNLKQSNTSIPDLDRTMKRMWTKCKY